MQVLILASCQERNLFWFFPAKLPRIHLPKSRKDYSKSLGKTSKAPLAPRCSLLWNTGDSKLDFFGFPSKNVVQNKLLRACKSLGWARGCILKLGGFLDWSLNQPETFGMWIFLFLTPLKYFPEQFPDPKAVGIISVRNPRPEPDLAELYNSSGWGEVRVCRVGALKTLPSKARLNWSQI